MTEHIIPGNIGKMPLRQYLSRAYPMLKARDVLKKRDVKVNGVRRDGEFSVSGGDVLQIYAAMDFSIEIAGEAEGLFAVVKPQGLPVDRDGAGIGADTALERARLIYPGAELCHRLDAQTGGVLIMAYEKNALKNALDAFRNHNVGKRYTAIVSGKFDEKNGVYRDFLIKDAAKATVRISSKSARGALSCETRWEIAGDVGDGLTKAYLEPVTGRTHQLRAHMAYYGRPILGDDKYGDRKLNKKLRTKLCLWCDMVEISGHVFRADAPDWLGRGK